MKDIARSVVDSCEQPTGIARSPTGDITNDGENPMKSAIPGFPSLGLPTEKTAPRDGGHDGDRNDRNDRNEREGRDR